MSDGVLLSAATPDEFRATHLRAHLERHGGDEVSAPTGDWLHLADLLADGERALRELHATIVANGSPAGAAATYLAGWIGGSLADVVGFTLATTRAGVVVAPGEVRWRRHPGGWIDAVDVGGAQVLVADGHRWGGHADVTTVDDLDTVVSATVASLVAVLEPVIDACHRLARVGRAGLWNEVADGFGMSLAFQPELPVDGVPMDLLDRALRHPGVPWKARPTARVVAATFGDAYVAQRGGCCLAYTAAIDEPDAEHLDLEQLDDEARAHLARFPADPPGRRYCSTCSLRAFDDCVARQLFWLERHRGRSDVEAGGTAS